MGVQEDQVLPFVKTMRSKEKPRMPRQLSALILFFVTLLGSGTAHAQTTTAVESKEATVQQTSVADARVRSATALGDIFFKSRNSFVFSTGTEQLASHGNLFFEEATKRFERVTDIYSRMAYQRQYPRSSLAFDYTLGSRIYSESDSYNQLSHVGALDLQYRLSPRLSITMGDRVSVTAESGGIFQKDLVVEPLQDDIAPNTSVLLPWNKTLLNTAFAGFSYELNQRSKLTAGAGSSLSRFDQDNLRQQNRYGGTIRYSYELTEKTTLGLNYVFSYFDSRIGSTSNSFLPPSDLVRNHMAYVGIRQRLAPSVTAFIDVGANVTSVSIGDPLQMSRSLQARPGVRPSVGGGILFTPSIDPRTFFSFDLRQSPSDGSGLGTIAEVQTVEVSLGRWVSRGIRAAVSMGYHHNKFLADFDSSGQQITTNGLIAGSELRFALTDRISLLASYGYLRQVSTGFFDAIPQNLSGNGVRVGLSYAIPVFF